MCAPARLVWIFHTIPRPGEPGYETWPADAWKTAGAANNWAGMTLDAARGIVFVPTGSAVFDFYGGDRMGNDLYADCELALDAATGKRLWHFQGVHHDIWDRDFSSPPALFTFRRERQNGGCASANQQAGAHLRLRTRDRQAALPDCGTPLSGQHRPRRSCLATMQPLPVAPEPFARQRLTEDMLTTRTPEAHAWAVKEFRDPSQRWSVSPICCGQSDRCIPGI